MKHLVLLVLMLALPSSADELRAGGRGGAGGLSVVTTQERFGVTLLDSVEEATCAIPGSGSTATFACGASVAQRRAYRGTPTLGTFWCMVRGFVSGAASETITFTPEWTRDPLFRTDGATPLTFPIDAITSTSEWSGAYNEVAPYDDGALMIRIDYSNPATAFSANVSCVVSLTN